MNKASGRLTVFSEEPFWVEVFERNLSRIYSYRGKQESNTSLN
nr:hypothetical protein [uncultured Shuttleworthia sp.]